MTTPPNARPAGVLRDRLRSETRSAHLALELHLGFEHRPSRALATAMLIGFRRVLTDLEPALSALVPDITAGREKLALLDSNLSSLGIAPDTASRASQLHRWIPGSSAEAIGALYVLEGSTLGGKVITKALRRIPDWPLGEESYFNPYGAKAGAKWLDFLTRLETVPVAEHDQVVAGASRTFMTIDAAMDAEVTIISKQKVPM